MRPGYFIVDTALGAIGISWSARGLTRLQLPGRDAADTERRLTAAKGGFSRAECARDGKVAIEARLPAEMAALVSLLRRYAAGEPTDFSGVAVDLVHVGEFRSAIYARARQLGHGQITTYGELCARAGHEGIARETGQAMGSNPVPLVVPCHRVLAAGHRIGGFSAPGGAATKERLLALEGVRLGPPPAAQAAFAF